MSDSEQAFLAELRAAAGTPLLTAEEIGAVLDLARVVAHRTQRRCAPLSVYAMGLVLGGADPAERAARLQTLARAWDVDDQPQG